MRPEPSRCRAAQLRPAHVAQPLPHAPHRAAATLLTSLANLFTPKLLSTRPLATRILSCLPGPARPGPAHEVGSLIHLGVGQNRGSPSLYPLLAAFQARPAVAGTEGAAFEACACVWRAIKAPRGRFPANANFCG